MKRVRKLYEAEGSIYVGMKGAVSVADAPDATDGRRTIAACPEWGDALLIAESLNASAAKTKGDGMREALERTREHLLPVEGLLQVRLAIEEINAALNQGASDA